MLDTHRRNHDKLVAQICANQLKIQTKKDVLSLSVRARSLPSFEGMDTENRLMGTFFLFFDYRYSDYRVCVEIFHFVPILSISPRSWVLFPGSWRKEHAREFGSPSNKTNFTTLFPVEASTQSVTSFVCISVKLTHEQSHLYNVFFKCFL